VILEKVIKTGLGVNARDVLFSICYTFT